MFRGSAEALVVPKKYCPNCNHAIVYENPREGEETACAACGETTVLDGITVDGGETYKPFTIPAPGPDPLAALTPADEPPPLPPEEEVPKAPLPPAIKPRAKSSAASASTKSPTAPTREAITRIAPPAGAAVAELSTNTATNPPATRRGDRALVIGIGVTLFAVACFFVYVFLAESTRRARLADGADNQPTAAPPPVRPAKPVPQRGKAVVAVSRPTAPSRPVAQLKVEFPQLPEAVAPNNQRLQDNTYQAMVAGAFRMPYRLFGNTVVDLRSLNYAVRNGITSFPDGWNFIAARVETKQTKALTAKLVPEYHGDAEHIYLTNAPGLDGLDAGDPIAFLGRARGTWQVPAGASVGPTRTIKAFDLGTPPSNLMIERANVEAAKRADAQRRSQEAAARAMEEKRKKEAEERQTEKDKRAVASLERRIKQGSSSALYSLGLRYLEGRGVKADKSRGMQLLKSAAAKNNGLAKRKLAELQKR